MIRVMGKTPKATVSTHENEDQEVGNWAEFESLLARWISQEMQNDKHSIYRFVLLNAAKNHKQSPVHWLNEIKAVDWSTWEHSHILTDEHDSRVTKLLESLYGKPVAPSEAPEKSKRPLSAPVGQEYVDPLLFETGHFESREEYEELTRTAKIKPRTQA